MIILPADDTPALRADPEPEVCRRYRYAAEDERSREAWAEHAAAPTERALARLAPAARPIRVVWLEWPREAVTKESLDVETAAGYR